MNKPTIEELEEILDGKNVDIEILPSGEIVERTVGDSGASSWPEQEAVYAWIDKYFPNAGGVKELLFKAPNRKEILELCEAVSKYRIQEQKKAKNGKD